jgi:hypothetical protein
MSPPKFYICATCSTKSLLNNSTPVYRCGDAYVCSRDCSEIRLEKIMGIDPLLTIPMSWDSEYDTHFENTHYHNNSTILKENELTHPLRNDSMIWDLEYDIKCKNINYNENSSISSKIETIDIQQIKNCRQISIICILFIFVVVLILNYTHRV